MSDPIERMPLWAQQLAEKYRGGTTSQFLIHGNIHDLVPLRDPAGNATFVPLRDFLAQGVFPQRDLVLYYDLSAGISAASPKMMEDLHQVAAAVDAVAGTKYAAGLPREASRALPFLERYVRTRTMNAAARKKIAIVIEYAEMICPAGQLSYQSTDESSNLITLLKWARDPLFLANDVTICLVVQNLAELHGMVVNNPYTAKIEIPHPMGDERLEFVVSLSQGKDFLELSDLTPEVLSELTAGLTRINLLHLVNEALRNRKRISLAYVVEKKKELIEKECYGLLEFLQPSYTLDLVSGHDAAKRWLREDARLIKEGKLDVVPMGYLICGPVGTGKTFLITCFVGEIGIPCVKLLNFRSQWQGVTEGNWEKILNVLKATGPVGVIIDEADAAVGRREASGDSGTSSRVFSQLASQMGDTRYRGRILWFLLTCRPDLLPVDLKRQGRAEVHIPLFYPDDEAERRGLVRIMGKKQKAAIAEGAEQEIPTDGKLSGADVEGLVVRAKRRSILEGHAAVTREDFSREVRDFIPPTYKHEVELQELAAVVECTSKEFLPSLYRTVDRVKLVARYQELQALLGG
ncbi:MAG: ATP-binding protein [Planctomycetes bacterium]|nr:ATP-binding protein [Planctomycetota bacterium]